MHIYTVIVDHENDFLIFFLSPLSNSFFSPTFTTTRRTRITTQPSIENYPKSTEKQLKNPTQNQDKPTENPTQNQSKLTSKHNPKIVQPHRKTQPKPFSTKNSREMPNGTGSAAIAAAGSSIAVIGWGWEAKGRRLGVGGEESVVAKEREGESELDQRRWRVG